jgi:radical SAM superfamily enzyme YgiQ (UPF0313 family)
MNDKMLDRQSGVHRIAYHLRLQNWDCEVIDFAPFWTLEELQELCRSRFTSDTKFIGLSYLFNRHRSQIVVDFCKWIKENYKIMIVSGGQLEKDDSPYIDYHISGYGEYALDTLLAYKFSNGPSPKFKLTGANTKIIDALVHYPAYPFKDPMIKYEARDFIMPNEWGRIEFSRGCKFKCKFCSFPVLGVKGDFTRDADSARKQMLHAYDNYGIENYLVTDETFNDSTEKIIKFADMVETLPWKPYFSGYLRADLIISRPEDKKHLLRMGHLGHFYGIETFNHQSAKAIGKGMSPDKLKEGLLEIKKYLSNESNNKYRGSISFIAGLPYETLESLEETYKWVKSNWLDQDFGAQALEIHDFTNYRLSDISMDYSKYGYTKIESDIWDDPNFLTVEHGTNQGIAWKNEHMDIRQASQWANKVETLLSIKSIRSIDVRKLGGMELQFIYCDSKGNPLSLEQKLKLTVNSSHSTKDNFQIFVEEYKRKKLSI